MQGVMGWDMNPAIWVPESKLLAMTPTFSQQGGLTHSDIETYSKAVIVKSVLY